MNLGFRRRNDDTGREPDAASAAPTPETPVAPAVTPAPVARPIPEPPAPGSDGSVDFIAVYRHAGVETTPFTAEQTLEMLGALPADMPVAMRRQTIDVALRAMGAAFGATAEGIVSDADGKRRALQSYSATRADKTQKSVADARASIEALQRQIVDREQEIAESLERQSQVAERCADEAERLEFLLDFFASPAPATSFGVNLADASAPSGEFAGLTIVDGESESAADPVGVFWSEPAEETPVETPVTERGGTRRKAA